MTSCKDFMIFDVHFDFCNFSASMVPRKVVLYIFPQPSLGVVSKKNNNGNFAYNVF